MKGICKWRKDAGCLRISALLNAVLNLWILRLIVNYSIKSLFSSITSSAMEIASSNVSMPLM